MKDNEFFVGLIMPVVMFIMTLVSIGGFIFSIVYSSDISAVPVAIIVFVSFMLIIVPIILTIFMAWVYLPKIRIDEKGVTKIRFGRKINGFTWDKIVKIQFINGYIVLSTTDEIMQKNTLWVGWLNRKDLIDFFYNKKGVQLIQRYCPNKELLVDIDHLT